MTAWEFAGRSVAYFGRYKSGEEYVLQVVSDFVATKSEKFLDSLWKLLMERRPKGWGPPDLHALMELREEAAYDMDVHQEKVLPVQEVKLLEGPALQEQKPLIREDIDDWSPIDNDSGDRWLSQEETGRALALVYAKLAGKQVAPVAGVTEEARKPVFFPELEGVRPDTPVTLLDEFFDETLSMEERIERYAVRRAQVQAARKERER